MQIYKNPHSFSREYPNTVPFRDEMTYIGIEKKVATFVTPIFIGFDRWKKSYQYAMNSILRWKNYNARDFEVSPPP